MTNTLTIECKVCGRQATIKGYVVPATHWDPAEIVVDPSEDFSGCCRCIREGEDYEVAKEENQNEEYEGY